MVERRRKEVHREAEGRCGEGSGGEAGRMEDDRRL